jgi:hypothetical protein
MYGALCGCPVLGVSLGYIWTEKPFFKQPDSSSRLLKMDRARVRVCAPQEFCIHPQICHVMCDKNKNNTPKKKEQKAIFKFVFKNDFILLQLQIAFDFLKNLLFERIHFKFHQAQYNSSIFEGNSRT